MTHDESVERAIAFIRDKAKEFARAKAQRVYLEEFRKTKKSLLIQQSPEHCKTVADKESYAYAHVEYQELLAGLRAAVEREEELRLLIKAAELKFEQWRTLQANNRAEMGRYNT